MEASTAALIYLFTFLIPVNGLILIGLHRKIRENRRVVKLLWTVSGRISRR